MIYPFDFCKKIADLLTDAIGKEARIDTIVPDVSREGRPIYSVPTDKRALITVFSPSTEIKRQQGTNIEEEITIIIEVYYLTGPGTPSQANVASEKIAYMVINYLASSEELDNFLYTNNANYIKFDGISKAIPETGNLMLIPQIQFKILRAYSTIEIPPITTINKVLSDLDETMFEGETIA